VSISVALGQVIYRNKARFVMTIVVSLLLLGWLTAAKLESVAREQESQAQARDRKAGADPVTKPKSKWTPGSKSKADKPPDQL
jgi:hypothetical protein